MGWSRRTVINRVSREPHRNLDSRCQHQFAQGGGTICRDRVSSVRNACGLTGWPRPTRISLAPRGALLIVRLATPSRRVRLTANVKPHVIDDRFPRCICCICCQRWGCFYDLTFRHLWGRGRRCYAGSSGCRTSLGWGLFPHGHAPRQSWSGTGWCQVVRQGASVRDLGAFGGLDCVDVLAGGIWQTLAILFNWSPNTDACGTGCLQR